LQSGIEQSLLAKLNAATSAVEKGQIKTAQNILGAFVNDVQAQRGKKITSEQADVFLNDAQTLINFFGESAPKMVTILEIIAGAGIMSGVLYIASRQGWYK